MNNRKMAIAWWRGLTKQEQFEQMPKWQDTLPENDFKRFWTLEMIAASSSCIEQMFNKHLTTNAN